MKKRSKLLIGLTLSMMLMGGAYATWTDGFNVYNEINTYTFAGQVQNVTTGEDHDEIDNNLRASAIINISDATSELEIKNTSTLPIYVDKVKIMYIKNHNMTDDKNYDAIRKLNYTEIGSEGTSEKNIKFGIENLFRNNGVDTKAKNISLGKDKLLLEPNESGSLDEIRTIELKRGLGLDDLTEDLTENRNLWNDRIDEISVALSSPSENMDTEALNRELENAREKRDEFQADIDDIKAAFESDQLEIIFWFKMAN